MSGEDIERKGSEVVVEMLRTFKVDHVFGLPGVHNLPIYDALRDNPKIRTITSRHESAASFMAQGYARLTWKPGVNLLPPGPGVPSSRTVRRNQEILGRQRSNPRNRPTIGSQIHHQVVWKDREGRRD